MRRKKKNKGEKGMAGRWSGGRDAERGDSLEQCCVARRRGCNLTRTYDPLDLRYVYIDPKGGGSRSMEGARERERERAMGM